jgi:hypothetical protein
VASGKARQYRDLFAVLQIRICRGEEGGKGWKDRKDRKGRKARK